MNSNNDEAAKLPSEPRPMRKLNMVKRVAIAVGTIYFLFVLLLAIFENNLVYPGSKFPRGDWDPEFAHEEVVFESEDGTRLVGWFLPFEGASENVLVCHGNAENIAQSSQSTALKFQSALNANVFVFDYRGYGKSEGSPFEHGVLEDAEAALDWLTNKTSTAAKDIILVGHSIGGGPAVHLADKRGVKALYLQRTFSSLVEPAQNKYWFVPVSWIMKNRFESARKIKQCKVPLHQSHGDQDRLVPYASGRKLFNCSPAKLKQFFVNKGKGHWDHLPVDYWISVREFLNQINIRSEPRSKLDE